MVNAPRRLSDMDLFNLMINENQPSHSPLSRNVARQINVSSPMNSPSRLSLPDLSETDQSTGSDGRDTPTESEKQALLTTEMKLQKARARREEMNRIREIHLLDKKQQALERAQKNMEGKREKMRKKTSRIANVRARRNLMEKKQRERLTSMESKLNSAVSRAEQICRKKQIKARNIKRVEKAKKRRELLEFERRLALLSGVDRRSEIAQKNMETILRDRQCKAREEIEHAQRISRRVRAARILQRAARAVFGVQEPKDKGSAAVQIQCWDAWRLNVACRRFVTKRGAVLSPVESLKSVLSKMGHNNVSFSRSSISFEMLTTEMRIEETLHSAKVFLSAFEPILGALTSVSERTLLSVFLIDQQPIAVLGPKRGTDKCSCFLESTSHRLVKVLIDLARMNHGDEHQSDRATLVKRAATCILSYVTLFEKWKNADIDNLVMQMTKSATQSWIAYSTAKDTHLYIKVKEKDLVTGHGDPFFQHKIRSKLSKRGAWSHIKRIHSSLQKILGLEEALRVMKTARKRAVERIDEDDLVKNSRIEIDILCETEAEQAQPEKSAHVDLNDVAALDDVNEHVVHEILLADNEDLSDQLFKDPASSVVDCVKSFMAKFKDDTSQCEVTADTFAFKMEKAFFDQMKDNWISKDIKGMHEMLAEMFTKMRNLVPNRTDLHNHFSHDEALRCLTSCDFLEMLARIGHVMGDSLESPHRAESTSQWLKATFLFCSGKTNVPFGFPDIESYVVVSMAFLVKKLDVCHADIVNFRLVKVTPLIRANGLFYERQRFQQRHGSSIYSLHGTKTWMARMKPALLERNANLYTTLKEGFVDELLFVQERISMPEVFCLDAARIGSIRERVQRIVISSSLFLHACNIVHVRFASLQSKEALAKVNFDKNEIMKSLKNNLSYDELYEKASSSILSFAKGITGKDVENHVRERLLSATDSVLKGSDPVLSLMDQRVRDVFKTACTFDLNSNKQDRIGAPKKMRAGIGKSPGPSMKHDLRELFCEAVTECSTKLGFYVVTDVLVDAAYDAFKVIDHCVRVHYENVFYPIANDLKEAKDN